jgi:hypothetical protein
MKSYQQALNVDVLRGYFLMIRYVSYAIPSHCLMSGMENQVSVGSGSGAPTLGSGGCSPAFAVALSPAAIISFPAPSASNVACGFPRTTLTCLLQA